MDRVEALCESKAIMIFDLLKRCDSCTFDIPSVYRVALAIDEMFRILYCYSNNKAGISKKGIDCANRIQYACGCYNRHSGLGIDGGGYEGGQFLLMRRGKRSACYCATKH